MSSAPTVSVVVTTYNYAHYLPYALDSVLRQTYVDYELLVIDDGSTDHTPEVVQRYLDVPRLRYIRKANGGQASAKNRGILEARGRYVAFLDADDLWAPEKLELQMALFAGNERLGIVYSGVICIGPDGAPVDKWTMPAYRGRVTKPLFIDNFIPFSSAVVKKECFERLGTFDESLPMAIDYDLWLRFSTEYEVDFVDRPLLYYRRGHGHMSDNVRLRFECASRVTRRFLETHPGLIDRETYRRDRAYSLRNRGDYYGRGDLLAGLGYYLKALWYGPADVVTYKRAARLLLDRAASAVRRVGPGNA